MDVASADTGATGDHKGMGRGDIAMIDLSLYARVGSFREFMEAEGDSRVWALAYLDLDKLAGGRQYEAEVGYDVCFWKEGRSGGQFRTIFTAAADFVASLPYGGRYDALQYLPVLSPLSSIMCAIANCLTTETLKYVVSVPSLIVGSRYGSNASYFVDDFDSFSEARVAYRCFFFLGGALIHGGAERMSMNEAMEQRGYCTIVSNGKAGLMWKEVGKLPYIGWDAAYLEMFFKYRLYPGDILVTRACNPWTVELPMAAAMEDARVLTWLTFPRGSEPVTFPVRNPGSSVRVVRNIEEPSLDPQFQLLNDTDTPRNPQSAREYAEKRERWFGDVREERERVEEQLLDLIGEAEERGPDELTAYRVFTNHVILKRSLHGQYKPVVVNVTTPGFFNKEITRTDDAEMLSNVVEEVVHGESPSAVAPPATGILEERHSGTSRAASRNAPAVLSPAVAAAALSSTSHPVLDQRAALLQETFGSDLEEDGKQGGKDRKNRTWNVSKAGKSIKVKKVGVPTREEDGEARKGDVEEQKNGAVARKGARETRKGRAVAGSRKGMNGTRYESAAGEEVDSSSGYSSREDEDDRRGTYDDDRSDDSSVDSGRECEGKGGNVRASGNGAKSRQRERDTDALSDDAGSDESEPAIRRSKRTTRGRHRRWHDGNVADESGDDDGTKGPPIRGKKAGRGKSRRGGRSGRGRRTTPVVKIGSRGRGWGVRK